jgi:hypothetical protein
LARGPLRQPPSLRSGPKTAANRTWKASSTMRTNENALSLAAIEAELKPKVLEPFDNIAATYKKLRKLQDKKVEMQVASEQFNRSQRLVISIAKKYSNRRSTRAEAASYAVSSTIENYFTHCYASKVFAAP